MRFEVMEDFKIKTASIGVIELHKGQIVELSPEASEEVGQQD